MPKSFFRTLSSAVALALGLAVTPAARAAEPLAVILFTGNTYGNVAPCPS